MKKVTLVLSVLILKIVSCDKEENVEKSSIIGKWLLTRSLENESPAELNPCTENDNILFTDDNNFVWELYEENGLDECVFSTSRGTWQASENNKFLLSFEGDSDNDDKLEFILEGNELREVFVEDGTTYTEIYTKQ